MTRRRELAVEVERRAAELRAAVERGDLDTARVKVGALSYFLRDLAERIAPRRD